MVHIRGVKNVYFLICFFCFCFFTGTTFSLRILSTVLEARGLKVFSPIIMPSEGKAVDRISFCSTAKCGACSNLFMTFWGGKGQFHWHAFC